jgi:hypothetical protein
LASAAGWKLCCARLLCSSSAEELHGEYNKLPDVVDRAGRILDKLTGVSGDGFLLRCRYFEIQWGVVSAAPKPSPIDFAACVSARKPKFTSCNHRCLAGCPACPPSRFRLHDGERPAGRWMSRRSRFCPGMRSAPPPVCIGGSRAAPPEDCASARVIAQAEGVPFPFQLGRCHADHLHRRQEGDRTEWPSLSLGIIK